VKSMMGPQACSAHGSSPAFGFGSSTREHMAKIFLSTEHAKLASSSVSPGPNVYMMRSTVGPQVNGSIVSAPQWAFGSDKRFGGPGQDKVPGPGTYEYRSSLGAQIDGLQPTQPIFGMGSGTRDKVQRVYISEKHSTSMFTGVNSPGPASYTLNTSVGRQGASTKANQPSWVFGSCKRFQNPDLNRSAKAPGPDAYDSPTGVGPQVSSTKRSAPLPGFGTSNRAHMAKLFMSPAHVRAYRLAPKLEPDPPPPCPFCPATYGTRLKSLCGTMRRRRPNPMERHRRGHSLICRPSTSHTPRLLALGHATGGTLARVRCA
jgi:hypothetical protein